MHIKKRASGLLSIAFTFAVALAISVCPGAGSGLAAPGDGTQTTAATNSAEATEQLDFAIINGLYTNASPYAVSIPLQMKWSYEVGEHQRLGQPVLDQQGNIVVQHNKGIACLYPAGALNWQTTAYAGDRAPYPRLRPTLGKDDSVFTLAEFTQQSESELTLKEHVFYCLDSEHELKTWYRTPRSFNALPAVMPDGRVLVAVGDVGILAYDPVDYLSEKLLTIRDSLFNGQVAISPRGQAYFISTNMLWKITGDGEILWSIELPQGFYDKPDLEDYQQPGESWSLGFTPNYVPHHGPLIDDKGDAYAGVGLYELVKFDSGGWVRWRKNIRAMESMACIASSCYLYVVDPEDRIWRIRLNGSTSLFLDVREIMPKEREDIGGDYRAGGQRLICVDNNGVLCLPIGNQLYFISANAEVLQVLDLPLTVSNRVAIGSDGSIYCTCTNGTLYALGQ